MYLVDTNAVPAQRRPRPHGAVLAWIDVIASPHQVLSLDGPAFRAYARLRRQRPNDQTEDLMIATTAPRPTPPAA